MEANSVSIATDLTSGSSNHTMSPFPDFWETTAPMNWMPGSVMGKHAIAASVKAHGQGLVLDGHDLGPLLNHAPANFPLHSAKSSRKTNYAASTVVVRGKPAACADVSKRSYMMLCGDPVCTPLGENDTNQTHSVFIGMTDLDRLKGQVNIGVAVATDAITCIFKAATATGEMEIGDLLGDTVRDVVGYDPTKAVIGVAVGLVGSVAISYASGWKEPIVVKGEVGGGYGGVSSEFSYQPTTGTLTRKESVSVAGIKLEAETDYSKVTGRYENAWTDKKGEKSWGPAL